MGKKMVCSVGCLYEEGRTSRWIYKRFESIDKCNEWLDKNKERRFLVNGKYVKLPMCGYGFTKL